MESLKEHLNNSLNESTTVEEVLSIFGDKEGAVNTVKSDAAKIKALLWMYAFQTDSEKASKQNKEFNGVGFRGIDSKLLTSFAKQFIEKGFLSPKQLDIVRRKMYFYVKQLVKLVNGGYIKRGSNIERKYSELITKWMNNNKSKY